MAVIEGPTLYHDSQEPSNRDPSRPAGGASRWQRSKAAPGLDRVQVESGAWAPFQLQPPVVTPVFAFFYYPLWINPPSS